MAENRRAFSSRHKSEPRSHRSKQANPLPATAHVAQRVA
jgi:hypothetical protein